MPRITKVYTRTGDDGSTGLGTGRRVGKDDRRIEAYGAVDELNSDLGSALAGGLCERLSELCAEIQNELFHLGSDLCVPVDEEDAPTVPRIEARHVRALEVAIDELSAELPPLENFILPGGSVGGAHLHIARTTCRRAERRVVRLAREETVSPEVARYLNRLSDLLFVAARYENRAQDVEDVLWESRR